MFRCAILCFAVLVSGACGQLTEDEKKEMNASLMPTVMKCMQELGITEEQMEEWKGSEEKFDPCLMSCIFKGEGVMDENGMFDDKEVIAHASKVVKNSDTLNQLKEIAEFCSSVNKEKVNDGAKGCDRAMLITKCFKERRSNLGIA